MLGSTIVYTHITSSCQAIFSFDASTSGPPTEFGRSPGYVRSNPSIGSSTVAWEDFSANPGVGQIFAYDRGSATATAISDATVPNEQPTVSPDGALITWTRCDSSLTVCHIWDASRGASGLWTPRQLTSAAGSDQLPDTDGSIVVYQCARGGEQDICWQPAGGGTETELAFAGADRNPRLSGHLITFEHYDSSAPTPNWDMYAYDISSGVLYRITATPLDESLNDVWSNPSTGVTHVAWSVQNASTGYDADAASFTLPAGADRHGDAGAGATFRDADPNGNLASTPARSTGATTLQRAQPGSPRTPSAGLPPVAFITTARPAPIPSRTIHDSAGASASKSATVVVPSRDPRGGDRR